MGLPHIREPGGVAGRVSMRTRLRFGLVMWRIRATALVPILSCLATIPARAHDVSFSYADLHWTKSRIEVRLTVHRDDAAQVLGVAAPESLTNAAFLAGRADALSRALLPGLRLQGDGREIALQLERAATKPDRRSVTLTYGATLGRPVTRIRADAHLFPGNPQHETFINVYAGDKLARQDVLTATRPGVDVYAGGAAGLLAVLGTFVQAGIHHIFIGPDHILFIVGLLLLGGGLGRVLRVATSFTVAHSITLALAALGLVHLSSRLVEPLIALSIVYVGSENVRRRSGGFDWRTRIAFGFGLIHGFGFASVLQEFGLPHEALAASLLGFNLGVEIGQASIVLSVLPVLGALNRWLPRFAPRAVAACSWGIILAGGWWFLQRVLVRA
jgi:hydrogenase/urease accessory protein HupE